MSCWRCWLGIIGAALLIRVALVVADDMAESAAREAGAFGLVGVVVIDGDTIEAAAESGPMRVRLWGIDAPDHGDRCPLGPDLSCYRAARLALASVIDQAGAPLVCWPRGEDRAGRVVAECRGGWREASETLAHAMVRLGYAVDWPKYSHGAFAEIEAEACAARRGLWPAIEGAAGVKLGGREGATLGCAGRDEGASVTGRRILGIDRCGTLKLSDCQGRKTTAQTAEAPEPPAVFAFAPSPALPGVSSLPGPAALRVASAGAFSGADRE